MTCHSNIVAFRPVPQIPRLRRPKLLIAAARAGQQGWRRKRDLRAVLRSDSLPAPAHSLPLLKDLEERQNDARISGAADYDLRRHVMLLIAILAETRALREAGDAPMAMAPVAFPVAISPGTKTQARP